MFTFVKIKKNRPCGKRQGRANHELDLVWWQDLYNAAMLGKCALDYMLAECNWYNF